MKKAYVWLCTLTLPLYSNFSSEIAGEVSPSTSHPSQTLESKEEADDVIIMEEDSDYETNEEEDGGYRYDQDEYDEDPHKSSSHPHEK